MKHIYIKLTFVIICSVLLSSCASSLMQVESDPTGADVYLMTSGQSPQKLGQTPLQIQSSQIPTNQESQISVAKGNLLSESIYLPATTFAKSGRLFFKLKETTLPPACINQEASLQKLARGVAESQSQIKNKELDLAEKSLASLTTEFTTVSVLYDLLGNVYYLKKDLERAVISYKKSLSLNPANPETARIIKKIEEIRGGGQ